MRRYVIFVDDRKNMRSHTLEPTKRFWFALEEKQGTKFGCRRVSCESLHQDAGARGAAEWARDIRVASLE